MNAHFFDIDALVRVENYIWLVSKVNPKDPILKISQSEFNLIKKGIYRKYNCPLVIGNKKYWIPENLLSQIKIKCKLKNINIADIAFSMQEFMNPDIISNLDYEILRNHLYHLKNTSDDIYVICSKNTRNNYDVIVKKLQIELEELGLKIKNFYFISETFYNRDEDQIAHKKIRLLIQHLVGIKTDIDKFTNDEVDKYDNLYFYDDDLNTISLSNQINSVLHFILKNSKDEIKSKIKSVLKNSENRLIINQVTYNKMNPFNVKTVNLGYFNLIKTFENFKSNF